MTLSTLCVYVVLECSQIDVDVSCDIVYIMCACGVMMFTM